MSLGYTYKIMKEFRISKSSYNIKVRAINKKMTSYLKKNNVYTNIGVSLAEKIVSLRKLLQVEPFNISKKEGVRWLVDCWENGGNDIIKKTPALNFYFEEGWLLLRNRVISVYGRVCMRCGNDSDIEVDHIKPRSLYPELELDFDNLQILCRFCNGSKGNRHNTDYRVKIIPHAY